MIAPAPLTYDELQRRQETAYQKAWNEAPKAFKEAAATHGLSADINHAESLAIEPSESSLHAHYTPNMADLLDSQVDEFIEKHGITHATIIEDIVSQMQAKLDAQAKQNEAEAFGRVALYLVNGTKKNIMARIHGLLHCIPGMMAHLGFTSLRESAKACGCSQEWMKKYRDKWCEDLNLPVPKEASKSDEAKEKYAAMPHWRQQKFKKTNP